MAPICIALDKEIKIPGFGDTVSTKDLSLATRQLATLRNDAREFFSV